MVRASDHVGSRPTLGSTTVMYGFFFLMLEVFGLSYELYKARFAQVDERSSDLYLLNTGCL